MKETLNKGKKSFMNLRNRKESSDFSYQLKVNKAWRSKKRCINFSMEVFSGASWPNYFRPDN